MAAASAPSVPSGHLPRFTGEDLDPRRLILPRLRGRGTTRSVVERAR